MNRVINLRRHFKKMEHTLEQVKVFPEQPKEKVYKVPNSTVDAIVTKLVDKQK